MLRGLTLIFVLFIIIVIGVNFIYFIDEFNKPRDYERVLFKYKAKYHDKLEGKEENVTPELFENFTITVVSHMTIDREERLVQLCTEWDGPLSIGFFVWKDNHEERIEKLIEKNQCLQYWADFHLVYNVYSESTDLQVIYPFNIMRNIALQTASSKFVFLLDIDFLVLPKPHEFYKEQIIVEYKNLLPSNFSQKENKPISWKKVHENIPMKPSFIVPALESVVKTLPLPNSKVETVKMLKNHTLNPFYGRYCLHCHIPTQFKKWAVSKTSYEVKYQEGFEPYVIMYNGALDNFTDYIIPKYEERFVGRGWDKVSHFYEISLANYHFLVLPEVYVIHKGRPDQPIRFTDEYDNNVQRNKELWFIFKAAMTELYNQTIEDVVHSPNTTLDYLLSNNKNIYNYSLENYSKDFHPVAEVYSELNKMQENLQTQCIYFILLLVFLLAMHKMGSRYGYLSVLLSLLTLYFILQTNDPITPSLAPYMENIIELIPSSNLTNHIPVDDTSITVPGVEKLVNGILCKVKEDQKIEDLQSAIDWVCYFGGVDCSKISLGGPFFCNDIYKHLSWAVNAYFEQNMFLEDACHFNGLATLECDTLQNQNFAKKFELRYFDQSQFDKVDRDSLQNWLDKVSQFITEDLIVVIKYEPERLPNDEVISTIQQNNFIILDSTFSVIDEKSIGKIKDFYKNVNQAKFKDAIKGIIIRQEDKSEIDSLSKWELELYYFIQEINSQWMFIIESNLFNPEFLEDYFFEFSKPNGKSNHNFYSIAEIHYKKDEHSELQLYQWYKREAQRIERILTSRLCFGLRTFIEDFSENYLDLDRSVVVHARETIQSHSCGEIYHKSDKKK